MIFALATFTVYTLYRSIFNAQNKVYASANHVTQQHLVDADIIAIDAQLAEMEQEELDAPIDLPNMGTVPQGWNVLETVDHSIRALKAIAKRIGIKSYSRFIKAQLFDAITAV